MIYFKELGHAVVGLVSVKSIELHRAGLQVANSGRISVLQF